MTDIMQDVRYAIRALRQSPGFTVVAVLTLALGIGANTAVFSLVDGILLRPLPYTEPDRLVMIWAVDPKNPQAKNRATAPEYLAWQKYATVFEAMGTEGQQRRDLSADESGSAPESVLVQRLQSSLFQVLDIRPVLGRPFRSDEEQVEAPAPVVLLSERLWERRYHRDPNVINKVIRLDGIPTTIIGVMPASFSFRSDENVALYPPFAFNRSQVRGSGRGYAIAARLKPGVTIAQAQGEMDVIVKQVESQLPEPSKGWGARVEPLREALHSDFRTPLTLLQSVVAFVLLIACGNVAGLLLARASSRQTELALRAAIGAGRGRIVRQLVTESVVLAFLGGAAGLGVGWLVLRGFVTMSGSFLSGLPEVTIDGRVLAFTLVASLATGLIFGTLPAIYASRPDLVSSLKSSARGAVQGVARQRLRNGVVVIQIALAFVLLVGAGLLVNSFVRLRFNELGADTRGLLRFTVLLQGARFSRPVGNVKGYPLIEVYPYAGQTIDRILERVSALPGVHAVAGASFAPFTFGGPLIRFQIVGRPAPANDDEWQALSAAYQVLTPGFFAAMKVPMVQGREFDRRDTSIGPWGIIINEAMARQFWPDQNPIGQRLLLDLTPDEQPREVLGVVGNYLSSPYQQESSPAMFGVYTQQPPHTVGPFGTSTRNRISFVVRAAGEPTALASAIRAAMTDLDPDRPISDVQLVEEDVAAALAPSRYATTVFTLFAAVATLLAAVGIYGTMSYGIGQRTHEIGIRMALGANPVNVLGLIMRRVIVLVVVGVTAGLAGAVALARLMPTLMSEALWGVQSTDVPTYFAVSALMAGVALFAGWIPTRRAVRVDPLVALRYE